MRKLYVGCLMSLITLATLFSGRDASAASGPSSFSYEGRLYDTAGNASTQTVNLLIRVYDPSGTCLLREEQTPSINLATSDGYFSVAVGSNATTANDPGLTIATIFANGATLTGASACSYTPAAGDSRKIRIIVADGSTFTTLQPDLSIGSSPYAMSADTLQGLGPLHLVRINNTSGKVLTQASLESVFSSAANINALNALAAGTSTQYVRGSANGAAIIPSSATTPSTPASGQMWFDSTAGQMKFYDGSVVQTVGAAGGGSVNSVTGTAPVTVTGSASSPVVSMAAANASQNGYLSQTDWSAFNSKLSSALTNGNILIGNGSNVATAQPVTGDISMSSAGATVVNKLQTIPISGGAPGVAGQVLRYNGSSSYVPALLAVSDITGLAGQLSSKIDASNMPANCTAGQTLTFSSPSGTWNCVAIALPSTVIQSGGTSLGMQVAIGTNDPYDMQFMTNNTPRMSITQNGYVGVGTNAPIAPFHMKANSGSANMIISAEAGTSELLLAGSSGSFYPGVAMSFMGSSLQIGKVTNGSSDTSNPWVKLNGSTGAFSFTAITGSNVEAKMLLQRGNGLSAVPMNTALARIGFDGYNGSGAYSSSAAAVQGMSAEAFTMSANGAHLLFLTTPIGSNAPIERMRIDQSGQVGIGIGVPRVALDVGGAIVSAPPNPTGGSVVDFKMGNIQYTTNSCGSFQLHNLKPGGEYNFIVQGMSSTTCSFTAYSDTGSTALTVHLPPGHAATTVSTHTRYNMVVAGNHVYMTWTPGL